MKRWRLLKQGASRRTKASPLMATLKAERNAASGREDQQRGTSRGFDEAKEFDPKRICVLLGPTTRNNLLIETTQGSIFGRR